MLGRAAASISCGRIGALALWSVIFWSPTLCSGEDAVAAKPLATFPMGPDRMPFVTLSFGGKDYQCLIHTATSTTVLNEAVRPALGKAVGEQARESLYNLPTASLGPIRLRPETTVVCRDLSAQSRATGRPVDGIVGMDVLADLGLTLDFDRSVLILHESTYRPSEPRESVNIACHPQPHVMAQVCGKEEILAIEAGNGMELSLPPAMVEFYGSTGAAEVLSQVGVIKNSGGGPKSRFGSIATAGLNGSRHDRVLFFERSGKQRMGCLGNLFLARYNPTFLFASNEMLLAKSRWHDGHWWPGLRGMTLVELEGRLVVFSVQPGSPAAAAGIGPDDQIDLPTDLGSCLELWRNNLPLNLHVRKPSTEGFTAVRVEFGATGATGVPVAAGVATNVAEPLASFSMGPDRMAWATVSFGGKDYQCILDTGSQITAWRKSLKSELDVAARAIPGTDKYSMPEMAIGSLRVPAGTIATCVDLEALSDAAGSQIDCVIGMDVLASVALSLDFDQGVVTLHHAAYRPAGPTQSAKMYCLPRPYTTVGVGGQEVLMMFDSGFEGELSLRADFAGSLCERGDAAILSPIRSATIKGVRNSRTGLLGQAGFGTFRHERLRFMEQSGEIFDGLIGMSFLGRYNVTFRFAQNELVFSKSKWHDAEWWPDLCGMTMAEVSGRRLVFSVEPESAAFRAGVRPDDEVQLPRDFLRRWSFGYSQHHSPWHLTWIKSPLRREDSVPIEWRKPMWPSQGPVAVRVRRPGAADFVTVQVDDGRSLRPLSGGERPTEEAGRQRAADGKREPAP
ncbi:MAG: hypothetical protein U0836_11105 [Pirellulales bacterium]